MRRMLVMDMPGNRCRRRPSLTFKYACKRDMTEAGLKEGNTTNMAAWRKRLIKYTGDPQMTGQARDEEQEETVNLKRITSSKRRIDTNRS